MVTTPASTSASLDPLGLPMDTPLNPRFKLDKRYGLVLRQLVEQRLGLLQVGGVKALGEPTEDRCQDEPGFHRLALPLPQPTQAHHRPQLRRFRLLAAGNGEGERKWASSLDSAAIADTPSPANVT
jgi:hypothetical protein